MMSLYLFCAALGIPLLALFAFGGSDADADAGLDVGDAGFDGDLDMGVDVDAGADLDLAGTAGEISDFTGLFRRIPVSSYAFFLSFFGAAGALTTWVTDSSAVVIAVFAVVIGLAAAAINTAFFSFLRRTASTSDMTDRQIEGRVATVSVPFGGQIRGRVSLDTGDERLQLTARVVDGTEELERGDEVVIVRVENGIADVMQIDPELR